MKNSNAFTYIIIRITFFKKNCLHNKLPNVGLGDLVQKQHVLIRECDLFPCENHFEMHLLALEICLFENTCFVQPA